MDLGSKNVLNISYNIFSIIVIVMENFGVSMTGLRVVENSETGMALIFLNEKKENSIVSLGGSNYYYPNLNELPFEYKNAIDLSRFKIN